MAQSLPLPVLAQLQAEAGTPFNLLQGPLVRALLVKLGSSDHLMLLTMHHAVCDGWSFKVLFTPTLGMRRHRSGFQDHFHAQQQYDTPLKEH